MNNNSEKISREKIEQLVELYREGLIYFIARYVNDLDEAEDLAEDVFVEIIMHPDRFRSCSSEKTYLYAIGRNLAIDFIRKNHRISYFDPNTLYREDFLEQGRYNDFGEEKITGDEIRGFEEIGGEIGYSPEKSLISKERKQKLFSALSKLKPEYREAIRLVYFEEMSYDEAGQVMKKSRKQIENLVFRGKKALGNILESEGLNFE